MSLRRAFLALILLLVALHPLAHGEDLGARELTVGEEHHDSAECPCIRGGVTEVEAPALAALDAPRTHAVVAGDDGYASPVLSESVPPRAPPAVA